MTAEQTRETMQAYATALLAFGDYGRYLADDVTMTFMGTERAMTGRDAVVQAIDFIHVHAFSSAVELKGLVWGHGDAMVEAEFIGTHIGEFEGVAASLRPVRVPYSAAYTLANGQITALRLYFPFEQLMRQITAAEPAVAQAR